MEKFHLRPKPPSGPILNTFDMGAFFWDTYFVKKIFCLHATPNRMSFLTISNEYILFKTQGTRLRAIVAASKGQE